MKNDLLFLQLSVVYRRVSLSFVSKIMSRLVTTRPSLYPKLCLLPFRKKKMLIWKSWRKRRRIAACALPSSAAATTQWRAVVLKHLNCVCDHVRQLCSGRLCMWFCVSFWAATAAVIVISICRRFASLILDDSGASSIHFCHSCDPFRLVTLWDDIWKETRCFVLEGFINSANDWRLS